MRSNGDLIICNVGQLPANSAEHALDYPTAVSLIRSPNTRLMTFSKL